ncbi:MAG: bifunctional 4-hydroxy-2-oxoglutarate aldolase/2-dehydro-3-deoxy-phosphogluconate aldolase [Candidatus Omnitrophica bacterium]|nr:bifunctional 4-hydroxy-2-oxoglutarate aldolase/2-dehydro-3-deoxy-phosphogluconate aldolase [Candidatus Omnitrophota bacterium]
MDIKRFKEKPILGILRGIKPQEIAPLVEVIASSGLETIEITMNTPGAPDLIRKAIQASGGRLTIGAGTVLNTEDLKLALSGGATFIVLPVFVEEVVSYCAKFKIPVFPGALSPAEIYRAWNAGASMVKVFPANFFGPAYFKEVKAPFSGIELLACGGVRPENLKDFFAQGASAVAIGASTFKREWLEAGDYLSIAKNIKSFTDQLVALEKEAL